MLARVLCSLIGHHWDRRHDRPYLECRRCGLCSWGRIR